MAAVVQIVRQGFFDKKSNLEIVQYLQDHGVVPKAKRCGKNQCNREMKLVEKKKSIVWRCTAKGCYGEKTARDCLEFLSWEGNRNRLDFRTIMHLLDYWIWKHDVISAVVKLNLNRHTAYDWFHQFRSVCHITLDEAEQMGGSGELVQVSVRIKFLSLC